MGEFQELVKKLVDGMNTHAARIEAAKLKALGQVFFLTLYIYLSTYPSF